MYICSQYNLIYHIDILYQFQQNFVTWACVSVQQKNTTEQTNRKKNQANPIKNPQMQRTPQNPQNQINIPQPSNNLYLSLLILAYQIYLVHAACADGASGCEVCYDANKCVRCQLGYRLLRGTLTCEPCTSNIMYCARHPNYQDNQFSLMPGYTYSSGAIVPCTASGCSICTRDNPGYCQACIPSYVYVGGASPYCLPCTALNCHQCTFNRPDRCINCKDGYDNTNFQCNQMVVTNCKDSFSLFNCILCQQRYHLNSADQCVPCINKACRKCDAAPNQCTECQTLFGVENDFSCRLCDDPKCVHCHTDRHYCNLCVFQLYVGRTSAGTCEGCVEPNCLVCHIDNNVCVQCVLSYGLASDGRCILCPSSPSLCLTCDPYNILKCYTCPINMFLNPTTFICQFCQGGCQSCLNGTNCVQCLTGYGLENDCAQCGCIQCTNSPSSCLTCSTTNILVCLSCVVGSYVSTVSTCLPCPVYCVECVLNLTYLLPQCNLCVINTELTLSNPPDCQPLCGDLILMPPQQCQKELDIHYDGCTNACQVEDNFTCWENNGSICSFNGTLSIDFININAIPGEINNFLISVKIFPPLYVFLISPQEQIRKIFQINHDKLSVYDVQYDPSTNTLQFFFELKANIMPGENIEIMFLPMFSNMSEYLYSVSQSQLITIDKPLYYESSSDKQIKQIIELVSYVLVVLGWISFILGIFLKRLPGLEAMFVLQTAFVVFLCLNAYMLTPFQKTTPLKYSTGYNYLFVRQQEQQQLSETSAPYFNRFGLSQTLLVNNFNLCMVLELVSLAAVLVTHVRLKNQVNQHVNKQMKVNSIKMTDNSKDGEEIVEQQNNNNDELNKRIEQNETSYTLLMNCTLLNLVNFVTCSTLFFKFGNNTNIASLIVLVLQILILAVTLLKFLFDPVMFGYFRFSFCISEWAMNHYFLHVVTLIATPTTLVVFLSDNTWTCLIAPTMLLVYTLIYRPYKQLAENLRSAFNLLVVDALLLFRVYFSYFCDESQLNSSTTMAYFGILMFLLLPAVVIISIISTVYYFYYYNYKLPKQGLENKNSRDMSIDQSRKRLLYQLVKIDPNKKMEYIKMDTTFKQLVGLNHNLLNVTNQWQEMVELNKVLNAQQIQKLKNCRPLDVTKINKNQVKQDQNKNGGQTETERLYKNYKKLMEVERINKKNPNNPSQIANSKQVYQIQFMQNKINEPGTQQAPKQTKQPNSPQNNKHKPLKKEQVPIDHQVLIQNHMIDLHKDELNKQQINKKLATDIITEEHKFINLSSAIKKTLEHMEEPLQNDIIQEYEKIDRFYKKEGHSNMIKEQEKN